jgi:hypothetical protein
LKRAFNKWKNTGVPTFGPKFEAYKEELLKNYNHRSHTSHENARIVKERMLLAKKYRHDYILHEKKNTFDYIKLVENDLVETRRECFAILRQRSALKRQHVKSTRQSLGVSDLLKAN